MLYCMRNIKLFLTMARAYRLFQSEQVSANRQDLHLQGLAVNFYGFNSGFVV